MKELTIHDIETIIRRDESRILEAYSTSSLSARKLGFPNLSMILSRTSFA
jgi:hypothetical protein